MKTRELHQTTPTSSKGFALLAVITACLVTLGCGQTGALYQPPPEKPDSSPPARTAPAEDVPD